MGLSVQLSARRGGGLAWACSAWWGLNGSASAQHCHASEESEWGFHGHFQLGEANSLSQWMKDGSDGSYDLICFRYDINVWIKCIYLY